MQHRVPVADSATAIVHGFNLNAVKQCPVPYLATAAAPYWDKPADKRIIIMVRSPHNLQYHYNVDLEAAYNGSSQDSNTMDSGSQAHACRERVLFIGTPSVTLALGAFTATTVL